MKHQAQHAGHARHVQHARGWAALTAAGLLLAGALQVQVQAQTLKAPADYPKQAITVVSPFPPGGGNDNVARLIAQELGAITGQSVVVENRSGAGGNVGTAQVSRAKPDGYTLVMSQTSVMAVNPRLYKNVGFDPVKDFTPISQITSAPLVLVARTESPYKTLSDYLDAARKQPGIITYATPGNGTMSHLMGALVSKKAGVNLVHVPYRGAAPAITDLMGGTVDMLITSPASAEPMVAAGKLRILALSHENSIGIFKGAPTLKQSGLDGITADDWYGLFAPAGTPPERVAYLAQAVAQAMKSPNVIAKINSGGSWPVGSQPDAFKTRLQEDTVYWADMVKTAGVSLD
ncbi:MAG TPA: ABC transporter substrate-binding protein [Achromobacter sp.]|uniref:Bug family tripartite tricarboxylate transporter substrate binding protein n=1 Tax=Achromobacter sp. B7 TaxID=2282475 RepID=UPI000E724A53|nr:tripartite tricarboxylate transporter substrate binding protein [Achromobacter sp. B7]AYD67362.1 tripartite tricarboxylate transporter substrate binding protein [Achromobacter sp. B7]HCQ46708.1 ABC transporter substrate-binding protein [Achromobacter sp.]